ncbi:MAG: glycosyl hydrolase family 88 [Peptococcaceae bacterium]|nr:glycosyl hydrolase family 88 [Peptococcaceae bacterium]
MTKNRRHIGTWIGLLLVALIIGIVCFILLYPRNPGDAKSHFNALKKHIFSDQVLAQINEELAGNYGRDDRIVFLSLCDGQERASVVKGIGKTLAVAWAEAEKNANQMIADKGLHVVWVKADIVTTTQDMPATHLNKEMAEGYGPFFLRKGVACDPSFSLAFLESEMNGNRLYRYYSESQLQIAEIDDTSSRLNRTNINNYLATYYPDIAPLKKIPETVTVFSTIGFFCDENNDVYDLYGGTGPESGRRIIEEVNGPLVDDILLNASRYLYHMIKPDGAFVYGYYPILGEEINNYNILRHAGSIWSLINLYRMTHDESLVPDINAAIDYLLEGFVIYKDPDVAYVVERKADEIKLGGNGLTIIMLSEYMTVFETDKYLETIRHLANGILELEDMETGRFYHVLKFPEYSPKTAFRTVYYDGEATFALTRAYTFTQDDKYLRAAALAVDNFIAGNYIQYRDHWVAYSLNEITKYLPEPRYYEFALRNAVDNLEIIFPRPKTHPTYLELLMAAWQTYERYQESGLCIDYVDSVDLEGFAETIYKRAFHMLNAYFYPEYAMYMKYPDRMVGSVFIRNDRFRVRIDDIQHFIGGFYFYRLYYEDIRAYLSDEFIQTIHNQSSLIIGNDSNDSGEGDLEEEES